MRTYCLLILILLVFPLAAMSQVSWKPVTTDISFKIKNAGLTVTGRFTGVHATLLFSPDNPGAGSLKGTAEVATINTGIDMRDKDLQAEKYFNADKYKLIEVSSVKLYKKGTQFAGLFNVTIKGVTKQVEIPFEFNEKGNETEFKGSFGINRRDFGVGAKTLTMSDDLTVFISVKATK